MPTKNRFSKNLDRLLPLVDMRDGCWLWTGRTSKDGYGQTGYGERVHRVFYKFMVGNIPNGLQLDHLCRNRLCVNPKHLEPVTAKENVLRGIGVTAQNAKKTHCKHGHEFTEANTYRHKSWRSCKTCLRARSKVKKRK